MFFFFLRLSNKIRAFFSSYLSINHLKANGKDLNLFQISFKKLSNSLFFVGFLDIIAKIFAILPSYTTPIPFFNVTNGSIAYTLFDSKRKDPMELIFGIDFPA